MSVATATKPAQSLKLPTHRDPYYAGKWQKPRRALCRRDRARLGRVARQGRRRHRRRRRSRDRRRQGRVQGMAPRAAARARQDAARHRRRAAQERRRAGDARRRRLRQSLCRDGARRQRGRGAARLLRRPRHRDEGRLDPDGAGRGQLLGARAARRGRAHHPVQPSVHVRRRQVRRAARRRQHRRAQAAGAGAALGAAARRADRRHPAARRVERRAGRARSGAGARRAIPTSPWWR